MSSPSSTPAPAWGWVLTAAISLAAIVVAFATAVVSPLPVVPNLYIAFLVTFPAVGGALVLRRPHHRVGRLFVLTSAFLALGALSTVYAWLAAEGHVAFLADLALWTATWAYMPVVGLLPLLVAVFPTGRLTSRWVRPWLVAGEVLVGLSVLGYMVMPLPVNSLFLDADAVNPWGVESLAAVAPVFDGFLTVVAIGLFGVAATDLVGRWHRARGIERLQMRWARVGIVVCLVMLVAAVIGDLVLGDGTDGSGGILLWSLFFGPGFAALPAAAGVAVAQYRLYDLDRLVSRSITYGIVVAGLGATYVGAVLLLGVLVPTASEFAVAAATLVAAAAFTPLRRRVHHRVDRWFNRHHYDATRVLEEFGTRLRHCVELDAVTGHLVQAITHTVEPNRVEVWLPTALGRATELAPEPASGPR